MRAEPNTDSEIIRELAGSERVVVPAFVASEELIDEYLVWPSSTRIST